MGRGLAIIILIVALSIGTGISISFYLESKIGAMGQAITDTANVLLPENSNSEKNSDTFIVLPDSNPPTVMDESLKVEKVISSLSFPTSMTFVDHDDILILEKDSGKVRLVSNGTLTPNPVFAPIIENANERGLLGVSIANSTNGLMTLFLYFTESDNNEVRNRIYKFDWDSNSKFPEGKLLLDLPGEPGPNHDGGKIKMGPDRALFAVIGDLNRNGMLQNYKNGAEPDDTSVILRIDQNGNAIDGTSKYYAYGVRNSFGLAFDPLTGQLWDTENGPADYDEINIVGPGFNSGWEQIMGPIDRTTKTMNDLVNLKGSYYADPVFSWRQSRGITDIEFLDSTKLGDKYAYNIFVGDISGNLFFFRVSEDRKGVVLSGDGFEDSVADNDAEVKQITFGKDFRGVSDIETGPDGYLYILSFAGDLYRVVPLGES